VSVLDASTMAEALCSTTPLGDAARARLAATRVWHAPAILPAEVMSAIRGLALGGHLADHRAEQARDRLRRSRVVLHPFAPFADRVWDLRDNLTTYDAWYVALAERLDAPLVTAERRLVGATETCTFDLVTDER
jgi:predicted nucleic acid-binding protein